MSQFKEIPLSESLLNLQKAARDICHIVQNVTTFSCKIANNGKVIIR